MKMKMFLINTTVRCKAIIKEMITLLKTMSVFQNRSPWILAAKVKADAIKIELKPFPPFLVQLTATPARLSRFEGHSRLFRPSTKGCR